MHEGSDCVNGGGRPVREEPKTLLFVVNAMWFFLSHRLPIALGAMRLGYEVHVAGDFESQSEIHELTRHKIEFHHVPIVRGPGSPLSDVLLPLRLWSLYRRIRPSVIHHVTSKPIILGSLAAKFISGSRVVNAVSGLGYAFSSQDVTARLIRRPMWLAYRMVLAGRRSYQIFQNTADRDALFRDIRGSRRSVLIPGSGVDLDLFRAVPESSADPMVLLPARMLRDKGIVEFCQAASVVKKVIPSARFVMAGRLDPQNPAGLSKSAIGELCKASGAEWIGEYTQMPQLMERANLVCLPSYREGLPKALVEACAAGRAIVTTDVPGCNDVVRHGLNGLLVPPRNARALADAIQTLLADDELRSSMGKHARKRAETEFDVREIVSRTLDLYTSALSAS
jgi:glycosyltransferase involved in cell wall biosynthesis